MTQPDRLMIEDKGRVMTSNEYIAQLETHLADIMRENQGLKTEIDFLGERLENAMRENERLRRALDFYAGTFPGTDFPNRAKEALSSKDSDNG